MTLRNPARAICLASAISVALAAPAFAAPAGDEYLPKVPKATGSSAALGPGGTSASGTRSSAPGPQSSAPSAEGAAKNSANGGLPPVSSAPASSSDDSSDNTLLSPVVILLIAGVVIAAVGMTLRRRNADGPKRQEESAAGWPEPGKTPPTPDGEIVAGGDRTR
jgi:hypothetical protein